MQLNHRFIHGIRFITELQYWTNQSTKPRFTALPIQAIDDAGSDGGLMSLAQGLAIAGQLKFDDVTAALSANGISHPDKLASAATLKLTDQSLMFKRHDLGNNAAIGQAALAAIQQGDVCLICLKLKASPIWALVVGVETDAVKGNLLDKPSALLLLHTHGSIPWCTAHNARLELSSSKAVIYRDLTGCYHKGQIKSLCSLSKNGLNVEP